MTLQEQSVTIDGYKITYFVAGNPSLHPLMMVHGFGSYHGVWAQTIEALQENYHCVGIDLLGFGYSDKPHNADYSIIAQGKRVLKLADELGWREFSLMGHSMGGQIALCIASILAPNRIQRLVDVSGVVAARLSPFAENINMPSIALARAIPQAFSLYRWMARQQWLVPFSGFRSYFYRMDAIPLEDWAVDREISFQPHGQVAAHEAGKAIHALNLTLSLPNITAPTLIIFGKQDNIVPVTDAYLAQEHISNSNLVMIDECGHFPMYEKQKQYLEAVCTFLK